MAVADDIGLDHPHRPRGDARRGPAHAIGAARFDRLDQLGGDAARSERPRRAAARGRRRRGRRRPPAAPRGSRRTRRRWSAAIVSPAAIAWPPPATSRPCSFAASTAAPRSTPVIERPEPLPTPSSSSAMTIAGRPSFSFSRPATMPITPGCQPAPATTATARAAGARQPRRLPARPPRSRGGPR